MTATMEYVTKPETVHAYRFTDIKNIEAWPEWVRDRMYKRESLVPGALWLSIPYGEDITRRLMLTVDDQAFLEIRNGEWLVSGVGDSDHEAGYTTRMSHETFMDRYIPVVNAASEEIAEPNDGLEVGQIWRIDGDHFVKIVDLTSAIVMYMRQGRADAKEAGMPEHTPCIDGPWWDEEGRSNEDLANTRNRPRFKDACIELYATPEVITALAEQSKAKKEEHHTVLMADGRTICRDQVWRAKWPANDGLALWLHVVAVDPDRDKITYRQQWMRNAATQPNPSNWKEALRCSIDTFKDALASHNIMGHWDSAAGYKSEPMNMPAAEQPITCAFRPGQIYRNNTIGTFRKIVAVDDHTVYFSGQKGNVNGFPIEDQWHGEDGTDTPFRLSRAVFSSTLSQMTLIVDRGGMDSLQILPGQVYRNRDVFRKVLRIDGKTVTWCYQDRPVGQMTPHVDCWKDVFLHDDQDNFREWMTNSDCALVQL